MTRAPAAAADTLTASATRKSPARTRSWPGCAKPRAPSRPCAARSQRFPCTAWRRSPACASASFMAMRIRWRAGATPRTRWPRPTACNACARRSKPRRCESSLPAIRVFRWASRWIRPPVLRAVFNNGAAGMPNFRGTRYGVVTRISTRPARHALYGARVGTVHVDALAVHYDHTRWIEAFLANWPPGSAAHAAYFSRLTDGPPYDIAQAPRGSVTFQRRAPHLSPIQSGARDEQKQSWSWPG